jgi:Cu/Ag efflux protein CusF
MRGSFGLQTLRRAPAMVGGNKSGWRGLSGTRHLSEASMKIAKIVLASCAALTLMGSAGWAQQATTGTGTITVIDRISGTVTIRPAQNGTVGANAAAAATEFKVKGVSLDDVHAGEIVKYSVTETDGAKTITKLEKQ